MSAQDFLAALESLGEKATPAPWWVRHAPPMAGEGCFVAAKDVNGYPYDAQILGDDEYHEQSGGHSRQVADCELIALLANNRKAIAELVRAAEELLDACEEHNVANGREMIDRHAKLSMHNALAALKGEKE